MHNRIIEINTDQLSKLHFSQLSGLGERKRKEIKQRLKASLGRPLRKRQSVNIVFSTERGFFKVNSQPLSVGEKFTTVQGGQTIPLNSIVKVL